MHYLIALLCFVLALAGVDGQASHTHVSRQTVDGVDVLHSSTQIFAGVADITCVRSASGRCHYRLLTPACGAPPPRSASDVVCGSAPAQQFALATGASRDIAGLPAQFTLCVGADPGRAAADCATLSAVDPPALRW